nr:MAG TPA: hypothetical protein [Caudoviricetes sp.]
MSWRNCTRAYSTISLCIAEWPRRDVLLEQDPLCLLQDGVHLCVAEALTRHQLGDFLRCRHGPLILGPFVSISEPSHSHYHHPFLGARIGHVRANCLFAMRLV